MLQSELNRKDKDKRYQNIFDTATDGLIINDLELRSGWLANKIIIEMVKKLKEKTK